MKKEHKEFIQKAYSCVPLYVNAAEKMKIDVSDFDSLSNLPLIEKDDVMKNDTIIAPHAIPLLYSNKLQITRSSGSTGKYLDIYWKEEEYRRSMTPLWLLRKKYYDITPKDRVCFFYTIIQSKEKEDIFCIKNQLGFSKANLSMERLKNIYEKMQEYKPKWMLLQPSIAQLLCQCIEKYKLKPIETLKYIEMSGEILTDEIRADLKKYFNCKIANQYGANEVNSIAYECPEGNMHIMENNMTVEIIKNGENVKDGEEGKIYITNYVNNVMPLIRYGIGDIGRVHNTKCKCGNTHKILELTSGRANDYILCEDGSRLTAYTFVKAVDMINYKYDVIVKQFKITQTDINKFEIIFVVEDEFYERKDIEKTFIEAISDKRLENVIYNFSYVSCMFPDEKTGKFAYFKRSENLK